MAKDQRPKTGQRLAKDWINKGGNANSLAVPTTKRRKASSKVREALEICPAPVSNKTKKLVERGAEIYGCSWSEAISSLRPPSSLRTVP